MSEYVPDEQPPSISSLLVAQAEGELRAWPIPDDCCAFVRGMLGWDPGFDVAYFLEKPWKWAREFAIWQDSVHRDLPEDEMFARLEVAS